VKKQNTLKRRIFITDCEGPISLNDNAFELVKYFIPKGKKFFSIISQYDDILAYFMKKPNYKAGDTLKLILPFLKAYDVTNKKIEEFSSKHISLLPGAKYTLNFLNNLMPSFIISTSYEQYIFSLCKLVDFPFNQTYCTRLDLDKYVINGDEKKSIKRYVEEIVNLPLVNNLSDVKTIDDLTEGEKRNIKKLDYIFWTEIKDMNCGKIFNEINPIGGSEKAHAVENIIKSLNIEPCDVVYVGDSITDADALRMIRKKGGLAISFNGNFYSINESQIAVLSYNTIITAILVNYFNNFGLDYVLETVEKWSSTSIENYSFDEVKMKEIYYQSPPKIKLISENNKKTLIKESSIIRKKVRGEAIGDLG
jgi:energy-converting hydrogenase A subunit R